jgi:hypothetical protein
MKCIRRALRSDSDAINQLRINEFQRSSEFNLLNPEKLLWNAVDDQHLVLAAWQEENFPVATMRAVQVVTSEEALGRLECSLPEEIRFPAVIFNSAATHQDYRKYGLNQALRYYLFLAANAGNIQTLISPVYENAPRTKFMQILGYRFVEPQKSWQTKLAPHSRRMLGLLQRKDLGPALETLARMKTTVLSQYPFKGPAFEFDAALAA